MRTTIEIPFAIAARGSRTRTGRLDPVLLADSATIAVEVVASDRLVPVASVHIPRGAVQTVWSLDGDLVTPIVMDRHARGVEGSRRVSAGNSLADVLRGDGWELVDWRREVPEAVLSAACFDVRGDFDMDFTVVRRKALKVVEGADEAEAIGRLDLIYSRLLVVDDELWTRCPAPRLVVDDPSRGPYAAVSSDVHDLSVMDPDRAGRQFFSLDRSDDALAYCHAAAGLAGVEVGPAPDIAIYDPAAVAFDDLLETARMVAAPTLADLGRDLAWFSVGAMEEFATARAAAARLRSAPAREDALILFEAFSRIAADPGDPGELFDPPAPHLMRRLERFGLRATAFETDAVPDLALGAPAP